MTKQEYENLKREAETQYRSVLQDIEGVWKALGSENGHMSKTPSEARVEKKNLTKLVRSVLSGLNGDFKLRSVSDAIDMNGKNLADHRIAVSGVLKRLARNGELQIVRKGHGNRPNLYRKIHKEKGAPSQG